jgi:hypothetical protein
LNGARTRFEDELLSFEEQLGPALEHVAQGLVFPSGLLLFACGGNRARKNKKVNDES